MDENNFSNANTPVQPAASPTPQPTSTSATPQPTQFAAQPQPAPTPVQNPIPTFTQPLAQTPQPITEQPASTIPQPQPKKSHKSLIITIIAAILLIAGGTAAFFLLAIKTPEQKVSEYLKNLASSDAVQFEVSTTFDELDTEANFTVLESNNLLSVSGSLTSSESPIAFDYIRDTDNSVNYLKYSLDSSVIDSLEDFLGSLFPVEAIYEASGEQWIEIPDDYLAESELVQEYISISDLPTFQNAAKDFDLTSSLTLKETETKNRYKATLDYSAFCNSLDVVDYCEDYEDALETLDIYFVLDGDNLATIMASSSDGSMPTVTISFDNSSSASNTIIGVPTTTKNIEDVIEEIQKSQTASTLSTLLDEFGLSDFDFENFDLESLDFDSLDLDYSNLEDYDLEDFDYDAILEQVPDDSYDWSSLFEE